VLLEDLVLSRDRLGQPEHVPHVGVLGDDPERLLLAPSPDHDRQPRLDRQRIDPQPVEGVAATRRARHLAPVEQRADRRGRLGEPVEALPEAGPEVEPEGRVLRLEPRAADAQDRAPIAHVVDRRERLHGDARVAEGVGADEQPEPDSRCRLRERGQRRVALEDRLVRVAEDRVHVVPGPQVVVSELLRALPGGEERRPVARLAPQVDAQSDLAHVVILRCSFDCGRVRRKMGAQTIAHTRLRALV
jgi:hypothetical protein